MSVATTTRRSTHSLSNELALVQRYIRENERRIANQRDIVEKFHRLGLPARDAEDLLAEYETTLALYRQDLEAMLGEETRAAV